MVALIRKLRRKPRGGERLSFAAIAERLNAEGHPDLHGAPVGRGNRAPHRPASPGQLTPEPAVTFV